MGIHKKAYERKKKRDQRIRNQRIKSSLVKLMRFFNKTEEFIPKDEVEAFLENELMPEEKEVIKSVIRRFKE